MVQFDAGFPMPGGLAVKQGVTGRLDFRRIGFILRVYFVCCDFPNQFLRFIPLLCHLGEFAPCVTKIGCSDTVYRFVSSAGIEDALTAMPICFYGNFRSAFWAFHRRWYFVGCGTLNKFFFIGYSRGPRFRRNLYAGGNGDFERVIGCFVGCCHN